jgi:hypothetical protein
MCKRTLVNLNKRVQGHTAMEVLSQNSIGGVKSENRVSEIQWLTSPKTLEKANVQQNPGMPHEAHPGPKKGEMMETNASEHPQGKSTPQPLKWGPACNYPEGSNTCLTIKWEYPSPSGSVFSVYVGIDISMTRQEAEKHIRWMEGSPLIAYLVGDDGKGLLDEIRINIPKISTRATDDGLSAEFYALVPEPVLNEDKMNEGLDEVYALVELVEPRGKRRFTSGVIAAVF